MKKCASCGQELADNVLFCPHCGASCAENISTQFCPHCGTKNDLTSEYCVHCGQKLNGSTKPSVNPYTTYAIVFLITSLVIQDLILPILAIVYGQKGLKWCQAHNEKDMKNQDGYTLCQAAKIIGISKIAIVAGVIIIALMLLLAAYLNGTMDTLIDSIKDLLDNLLGLLE